MTRSPGAVYWPITMFFGLMSWLNLSMSSILLTALPVGLTFAFTFPFANLDANLPNPCSSTCVSSSLMIFRNSFLVIFMRGLLLHSLNSLIPNANLKISKIFIRIANVLSAPTSTYMSYKTYIRLHVVWGGRGTHTVLHVSFCPTFNYFFLHVIYLTVIFCPTLSYILHVCWCSIFIYFSDLYLHVL